MGVPYAEVIGDPIAHSKSPLIHKFWLEKLGLAGDYHAVRVRTGELEDYLETRRADPDWRGCNVTMPLKRAIAPLLDTITREAISIGAVNTVRHRYGGQLHGRNTDVHGVCRSLDFLLEPGMQIVLVGAGGAARAAAHAISNYKPSVVTVINRSKDRGIALLHDMRLNGTVVSKPEIPPCDLVINAVPPYAEFDLSSLGPDAVVFDMVYDPPEGSLLGAARRRGLRTVDGLTMLVQQATEAFAVFYDHSHPAEHDAGLRALLTQ